MTGRDIIVTWPKSRRFGSYMAQLELAARDSLLVNYHVRHPPRPAPLRCYRVHDGLVRGWLHVVAVMHRREGEVARVDDDPIPEGWPAGWYIVCSPVWHELPAPHMEMPGFRGWRWFDRTVVGG